MARRRREPCVKFGSDRMRPQDSGVARQVRVHTADPGRVRAYRVRVEMHDLGYGVHTGVGAAGADHAERVPGNPPDRVLECVLDAAARGLRLEAAEREARILYC